MMSLPLAAFNFAAGTPTEVYSEYAYAECGTWSSPDFAAASTNGRYLRIWHNNTTDEAVRVYLCNGNDKFYKPVMEVAANSQNSQVYYASAGTYHIEIEAFESGGIVDGSVSAAQYKTDSSQ